MADYKFEYLGRDIYYLAPNNHCYKVVPSESPERGPILFGVGNGKPAEGYWKNLVPGTVYVTDSGNAYIVDDLWLEYVTRDPRLGPHTPIEERYEARAKLARYLSEKEKKALDSTSTNPAELVYSSKRERLIPNRVICNPPVTIALWRDGTKTMARASKGTPYDPFTGVTVCVVKKIWGDFLPIDRSANGEVNRLLKAENERRMKPYEKHFRRAHWDDVFFEAFRNLKFDWAKEHEATHIPSWVFNECEAKAARIADKACREYAMKKVEEENANWGSESDG